MNGEYGRVTVSTQEITSQDALRPTMLTWCGVLLPMEIILKEKTGRYNNFINIVLFQN